MAFVKHIAAVAVSNTTYAYDRRYKYLIPPDLDERVSVGVRVIVPFGKGNRKRIGVVIRIDNANDLPPNETLSMFKPLRSVVDNESVLTPEMLDLMMWIRETTFCTYFSAQPSSAASICVMVCIGLSFGSGFASADASNSFAL